MTAWYNSESEKQSQYFNCTTASTFEKPKSIKVQLLFGNYIKKESHEYADKRIVNGFNYLFLPHEIFGFSYETFGQDHKKIHHTFILRSCLPGERGSVIPGVCPGAHILVAALSSSGSLTLKSMLKKIQQNDIDLSKISMSDFLRFDHLLNTKLNNDFLIGEIIEQQKKN